MGLRPPNSQELIPHLSTVSEQLIWIQSQSKVRMVPPILCLAAEGHQQPLVKPLLATRRLAGSFEGAISY